MKFVCLLMLSVTLCVEAAFASAPNVVIVITDDQGYGDLSCHGNPVLKTPHLDSLYRDSVRLVDYHVAPTCSPTRAAFLTGHWTNRTGVWHTIMGRSMLRENETTMGTYFQQAGYATGMFGKWHLGDNVPFRPEDRGYEEVLRHGGGGVGQTPDYWDNAYFDGAYWHNSKPTAVEGFCTDVFFDYAKKFIKAQHEKGRPFLAYIATNAPHGPMHAPIADSAAYQQHGVGVANFYGMIANIDRNVGDLRRFLKDEGLVDNTIFIFTTDNGTSFGASIFNAGMRGQKGSEYDGGHRVPFFIHWPQGKLIGGQDIRPISGHVDVVPTLLDLCRIPAPANANFDGRSFAPLLHSEVSQNNWPDRILVTDSQRVKDPIKWRKSSVMTSQWRLVNRSELYDIHQDPGQKTNVASQHPAVVERLTRFYESWWAELEPTFQQATAIYLGHPNENPTRLTSHDWITSGSTPWNQSHVRQALNGTPNTGYWNVNVTQAGTYDIRLRRWPTETKLPIDAALAPGSPVPGAKAFRQTPGVAIHPVQVELQIGDQTASQVVQPGDIEATFTLALQPGPTRLSAIFRTDNGQEYGAYFAYVQWKGDNVSLPQQPPLRK